MVSHPKFVVKVSLLTCGLIETHETYIYIYIYIYTYSFMSIHLLCMYIYRYRYRYRCMYNVEVLSLRWGDIQNFPQGNALKFTCLIGYVLSGSLDVLW